MERKNSLAVLAAAVMSVGVWGAGATMAQQATGSLDVGNSGAQVDVKADEKKADADVKVGDRSTGILPGDRDAVKERAGTDPATWNVRREMENVVQDALDDDLDDLVGRFVDADRNRIGTDGDTDKDHADLKAHVDALNKAWKDKFGHDFTTGDNKDLFADAQVKFGEVGDNPRLASEVAKNSSATPGEKDKVAGGDQNLEKGRNIATVSLPAIGADSKEMEIPLVREFPMAWKVNVPDSLSYPKLHANMSKHLGMVADSSKWPADEKEARKAVTRHVFMAILDMEDSGAQKASDVQAPSGSLSPALNQPADSSAPTDLNKPAAK